MEDLREVGQKVIKAIKNRKPVDAGDLVLGIGEIIEQLRNEPDQYQDRLNHLEGLFREFAYGEPYELRNDRTKEPEEDDDILGGFGVASGMFTPTSIPLSGTLAVPSTLPPVKTQPAPNMTSQTAAPQSVSYTNHKVEERQQPEEPEGKPFKRKWWMSK